VAVDSGLYHIAKLTLTHSLTLTLTLTHTLTPLPHIALQVMADMEELISKDTGGTKKRTREERDEIISEREAEKEEKIAAKTEKIDKRREEKKERKESKEKKEMKRSESGKKRKGAMQSSSDMSIVDADSSDDE
jgi:uncharacterized protein (DUF3084 family)